jgi:hypothetical protein
MGLFLLEATKRHSLAFHDRSKPLAERPLGVENTISKPCMAAG